MLSVWRLEGWITDGAAQPPPKGWGGCRCPTLDNFWRDGFDAVSLGKSKIVRVRSFVRCL